MRNLTNTNNLSMFDPDDILGGISNYRGPMNYTGSGNGLSGITGGLGLNNLGQLQQPNQGFDWGNLFSKDNLLGQGGNLLGSLQGFGNIYMGLKQYGLAKKTLKEGRDQFNKNYEAQRKLTNSTMRDRQEARLSASPGAYQSTDEYMKEHGI